jgi:hypothetical protein
VGVDHEDTRRVVALDAGEAVGPDLDETVTPGADEGDES